MSNGDFHRSLRKKMDHRLEVIVILIKFKNRPRVAEQHTDNYLSKHGEDQVHAKDKTPEPEIDSNKQEADERIVHKEVNHSQGPSPRPQEEGQVDFVELFKKTPVPSPSKFFHGSPSSPNDILSALSANADGGLDIIVESEGDSPTKRKTSIMWKLTQTEEEKTEEVDLYALLMRKSKVENMEELRDKFLNGIREYKIQEIISGSELEYFCIPISRSSFEEKGHLILEFSGGSLITRHIEMYGTKAFLAVRDTWIYQQIEKCSSTVEKYDLIKKYYNDFHKGAFHIFDSRVNSIIPWNTERAQRIILAGKRYNILNRITKETFEEVWRAGVLLYLSKED
jgi:hypothetical protein